MNARNGIGTIVTALLLLATAGVHAAELITSQVEQPPDLLAPPESNRGLLRLGMFEFIPQMSAGMTYDDNIFATSSNKVSDFFWTIAPGITAVASDPRDGKIFSLTYVPSFVFYTENSDQNNIGQLASLNALLPLGRLTNVLGGTMNIQQSAVQGTGQLVETRTFTGDARLDYGVGAKTYVEANAAVRYQTGENLIGNTVWDTTEWINHAFSARLTFGLGASFNYQTVEDASNQTFEGVLLRAVYTVSQRLVLRATAGPAWRQYDGQIPGTVDPYFTLGGTYAIGGRTTVNIDAVGRVQASLDTSGQNYYQTTVRLYVTQGLTEKLSVTGGVGYEHDRYYAVTAGGTDDGPVEMVTLSAGLNYQIRPNWSAGVFYNYRDSTGNSTLNEFIDNQAGIQSSWRY